MYTFGNAHLQQPKSARHTNMHLELMRQRSRLVVADEEQQSAEQNGAWDRNSQALNAYSEVRRESRRTHEKRMKIGEQGYGMDKSVRRLCQRIVLASWYQPQPYSQAFEASISKLDS